MRPKKRMTLELSRARASNNRENKRPGRDEEEKRALQEDLRMYYIFGNCWLSWATAFTASLLGPSVCHPMSTSQDTSCMQAGDEDACLRLGPRSKAPYLETHALARVFRGLVKEVGKRVARSDEKKNVAWSEA